jgi:predicted branched-subunit amino acid permease
MSAGFRAGLRAGLPFALAGGLLAASFGVLARDVGMPGWAAVAMSAIVFAGSAQIAALSILGGGGNLGSAIGAAALMNSRFLPMGIAIGPSLPGGPVSRAAQGQAVVDASWAIASDGEGGFDRHKLFGSSAIQYVSWVTGTAVGVFGGSALGDPRTLGLDAIYPAFFVALMIAEARSGRAIGVAALGALVAFLLVPVAPPGVPCSSPRWRPCSGWCGGELADDVEPDHRLCADHRDDQGRRPVALGGRELPAWFSAIVMMMAPALFAALVVTQALADGEKWAVGADTVGVALAAWRRGGARR